MVAAELARIIENVSAVCPLGTTQAGAATVPCCFTHSDVGLHTSETHLDQ